MVPNIWLYCPKLTIKFKNCIPAKCYNNMIYNACQINVNNETFSENFKATELFAVFLYWFLLAREPQ